MEPYPYQILMRISSEALVRKAYREEREIVCTKRFKTAAGSVLR